MSSLDKPLKIHEGVYQPVASVTEAALMITAMAIGAGVLGIPYVVAKVGMMMGVIFIIILGVVMMFLNLIIGEVAIRTNEPMQLSGFAGKYLGPWAKELFSVMIIFSSCGALLAYMVGEGQALATLLGGNPMMWGIIFWAIGSLIMARGLMVIKKVEKYLSLLVIAIIVCLSGYLLFHVQSANFTVVNWGNLFLPYGVILFALHASPAIAQAHALLPGSQKHFKRAVIMGSLIPMVVYVLFAVAVVGVSGGATTEIATLGLATRLGPTVLLWANLFAVLAMATCFIGLSSALKSSLVWDHKINSGLATGFVAAAPLLLYLLGPRSFVGILDLVGGLFIGVEAVLTVLIYYKARTMGEVNASRYQLRHIWLIAAMVMLVFTAASVYSIIKIVN